MALFSISVGVAFFAVAIIWVGFSAIFSQMENLGFAYNLILGMFPAFIGLVLISIIKELDNSSLALLWLISRTIYIPLYILGINYLRTGAWAVSLICLIMMSIKFF